MTTYPIIYCILIVSYFSYDTTFDYNALPNISTLFKVYSVLYMLYPYLLYSLIHYISYNILLSIYPSITLFILYLYVHLHYAIVTLSIILAITTILSYKCTLLYNVNVLLLLKDMLLYIQLHIYVLLYMYGVLLRI